jgi:hypothetical protein
LRWGEPLKVLESGLRFALVAADGTQFGPPAVTRNPKPGRGREGGWLRLRAARHRQSMEAEARTILDTLILS